MHARDLAELAAFVASRGQARVALKKGLSDAGLIEYWSASKCRYERWMSVMKPSVERLSLPQQRQLLAVMEEVLVSEMLTRVWTVIGCACDAAMGADDAGPILLNVWSAHLQARRQVLMYLVAGSGIRLDQMISANRTRRLCERWTDLLLGQLSHSCAVGRFSHSLRRLRQFSEEAQSSPDPDRAWTVLSASLRFSLQSIATEPTVNQDLNRRLAGAILADLPPEMFDTTGLAKSDWLFRIEKTSDDARFLLDELLVAEEDSAMLRCRAVRRPR